MIVGRSARDCENLKSAFEKKFTITSTSGDELEYLGIHIKVKAEGIALSQFAMVNKLVKEVCCDRCKKAKKGLKMRIPLSLVRMKVLEISLYVKADFSDWTKSQQ